MRLILKIIIPLMIIGGGVFTASTMLTNKPRVEQAPPAVEILHVHTATAKPGSYPAVIEVTGEVMSAQTISPRAQVSGRVVEISESFFPGRLVSKDDILIKIEDTDYRLAVERQQAIYEQAKADYDLELGQQKIAKEELKALEKVTGKVKGETFLALRGPQLKRAKAELEKARVDLEVAKLNLSRTEVKAPFDAIITARHVDVGSFVNAQDMLADLSGTDQYWVEASVSSDLMPWVLPQNGQRVMADIFKQNSDIKYAGYVFGPIAKLEEGSRLGRLLIAVDDPMQRETGASTPVMVLGDFVQVSIKGRQMNAVFKLPRSYVREGDVVWLAKDQKFHIQKVSVIFRSRTHVFVDRGLQSGDEIITTNITLPVQSMAIATMNRQAMDE